MNYLPRHLRPFLFVACSAILIIASGCTQNSARMIGAHGGQPTFPNQVSAHYELAEPVSAEAKLVRMTFLGIHFNNGDAGKYGSLTDELSIVKALPASQRFSLLNWLFGPSISNTEAISAAYFNAINAGTTDAVIETKVSAEISGFSLLGIVGWSAATARVNGVGVRISKGPGDMALVQGASLLREYTIQSGDTLYSIAQREWNDRNQWTRIIEANPNIDLRNQFRVGQVISLPLKK